MKQNPFSKNTVTYEQQKQISEQVRAIVQQSWDGIKSSQIKIPHSLHEDYQKRDSNSEPKK